MVDHPLQSLAAYSRFVAEWLDRSSVERSTVVVWPASPYTGIAEGEVHFSHGIRLRLRGWYARTGFRAHRSPVYVCRPCGGQPQPQDDDTRQVQYFPLHALPHGLCP